MKMLEPKIKINIFHYAHNDAPRSASTCSGYFHACKMMDHIPSNMMIIDYVIRYVGQRSHLQITHGFCQMLYVCETEQNFKPISMLRILVVTSVLAASCVLGKFGNITEPHSVTFTFQHVGEHSNTSNPIFIQKFILTCITILNIWLKYKPFTF